MPACSKKRASRRGGAPTESATCRTVGARKRGTDGSVYVVVASGKSQRWQKVAKDATSQAKPRPRRSKKRTVSKRRTSKGRRRTSPTRSQKRTASKRTSSKGGATRRTRRTSRGLDLKGPSKNKRPLADPDIQGATILGKHLDENKVTFNEEGQVSHHSFVDTASRWSGQTFAGIRVRVDDDDKTIRYTIPAFEEESASGKLKTRRNVAVAVSLTDKGYRRYKKRHGGDGA